jgi:UDP-N-acetylmuramoylalanine-D-glutamate ligase
MKLTQLGKKKILILGFGQEGKDNFLFLKRLFPGKVLGIADRNSALKNPRLKKVRWHLGRDYLKSLKKYDTVIKSPGIPFKILPKSALKKIFTQTDIFFENCPGKIVGITGTKGKSTTASMIYRILKADGIKAFLLGNIGKPVLSSLLKAKADEVFVYELSSHQLYNLKKSPQIAVFLNIFPEHLDYYRSFGEYSRAKANITLYQTKSDYLIFNSKDKLIKEFARKSKAKKIPIKGDYYSLNKAAAKAVGKIFKVPLKIIQKEIKKFKPLPHRLELVGIFHGITFYNDALATIPEATIGALKALGNKVETIILGGSERNLDFRKLAKEILKRKIKNLILFPTTGKRIWKEVSKAAPSRGVSEHFFTDNMSEAVKLAYRYTKPGKICLLSTASPSFSVFKDYKEKGDLFKKYVRKFGHGKRI